VTTLRAPAALLRSIAIAAFALACSSCIERPYKDAPTGRSQFDYSTVRDALVRGVPQDTVPVGAIFGNAAELLGYRFDPTPLVGGQKARITLFWRCRAEMEQWHIFVHLDDANGSGERIHAEHDPVMGRFPTDAWRPGDVIADSFVVTLGHVPLNLFVGLYSKDETRLTLDNPGRGRDDGQNRLFAGLLPVTP